MIGMSSCLCKVSCNYKGGYAKEYSSDNKLLICPEVLGGLSIPRKPVEIVGDVLTNTYDDLVNKTIKALDKEGNDYSQMFIDGANKALELIKESNISLVILKAKSPSCGINYIYDGSFTNKLIKQQGVLAALLIKNGISVIED